MKTLIIPTDFSAPAENAAMYALNLAFSMRANIHLCHALRPEGPDPSLGGASLAVKNFPDLHEVCAGKLKQFAAKLEVATERIAADRSDDFKPQVSTSCDFGGIFSVVSAAAEGKVVPMIIMGKTGAGNLNRFVFGSSTLDILKKIKLPLLIIPFNYNLKPIQKIAYSSAMSGDEQLTAQSLANLAGYFNAELLIANIPSFVEIIDPKEYQERQKTFLKNLEGNISFKSIDSDNIDSGLEILKKEDIDMLVMGHENRGFLDRFIFGSYALRHASHVDLPLLVIPKRFVPQF